MSVTMYFYKNATAELVDSDEYVRKFYRLNLDDFDTIELSYSLRNDFCAIYKDIIGVDFPTKDESYCTSEEALSCIINPINMFANIEKIVKKTNGLKETCVPNLDVAYMCDLFKHLVLKCAEGYSAIVDYA